MVDDQRNARSMISWRRELCSVRGENRQEVLKVVKPNAEAGGDIIQGPNRGLSITRRRAGRALKKKGLIEWESIQGERHKISDYKNGR